MAPSCKYAMTYSYEKKTSNPARFEQIQLSAYELLKYFIMEQSKYSYLHHVIMSHTGAQKTLNSKAKLDGGKRKSPWMASSPFSEDPLADQTQIWENFNSMCKLQQTVATVICARSETGIDKQSLAIQLSTPSSSQDSIATSQASTRPVSETNSPIETCAVLVDGHVKQFQQHLRMLFSPGGSEGQVEHKWRLCILLLIAFLRRNISTLCKSADKAERLGELQKWRSRCAESGDDFLKHFDGLLEAKKPPASGFDFKKSETKQFESCIFVLDEFVLQKLSLEHEKHEWKKKVNMNWFQLENTDSAADFLDRAEPFLRKFFTKNRMDGPKILGKLIPVNSYLNSYVVFFHMDALTSLLMRENCLVQNVLDNRRSQQARAAGQHKSSTSSSKISFMVSSANWHEEWLSEATCPSQEHVTDIVSGLQQIATIMTTDWRPPGVSLSNARSVEVQVC